MVTLDPQAQAWLDNYNSTVTPSVREQTVAEVRNARAAFRKNTATDLAAVDSVLEFEIPGPGGPIPVQAYAPKSDQPLPTAVFFHGGGWVLGNHSEAVCRLLSQAGGIRVVSVDYRLAPEHKYPAAAEDAYASVAWLAEHGRELGVDASQLAVVGASAGGNLAAVAALMARDRQGPHISAQILAYPVTDVGCDAPSFIEFQDGFMVSQDDMRWYWEQYLASPEQGEEPYASPLRAPDLSGLPPTLVITAEADPIRDDGERYAARLQAAGVPATLSRYDGMLHGFFANPGAFVRGSDAVREAATFLRATFDAQAAVHR